LKKPKYGGKTERYHHCNMFVGNGFFAVAGSYIVSWLYGDQYVGVNDILLFTVLVTLFSGLSTIAEKYLLKFNAYDYLKKKTLYLVAFNIVLTAICVYQWGLNGAFLPFYSQKSCHSRYLIIFIKIESYSIPKSEFF
jgi:O-antigen/teichoic acid export membrane protein